MKSLKKLLQKKYLQYQWIIRGIYYKQRVLSSAYKLFYEELADLCLFYGEKKIFEYGCGDGYLLNVINNKNKKIELFGVDLSFTQIIGARKINKVATYKVQSVLDLNYPNNFFDVVIGVSVLMYLPPEKLSIALQNIKKICKTLIIAEMSPAVMEMDDVKKFESVDDGRFSHNYERELENFGFTIVKKYQATQFLDRKINVLNEMGYQIIIAEVV